MSEVLPAEVIALIGPVPYLSTACQTEAALEACADPRLPGLLAELGLPTVDVLVAVFHARFGGPTSSRQLGARAGANTRRSHRDPQCS